MSYTPLNDASAQPKPASSATVASQAEIRTELPFENRECFENAQRGFIATLDPLRLMRADGKPAYDLTPFNFLTQEDAPDTVNPSLWRQAQLNAQHHGLFEVTAGIYQIRSFDIANMTLIKGETGWVVIDPLTSTEASAAGLLLANEHLGERPVKAVIYTHSHVDHFAGVLGVTTPEAVADGSVQVIAPMDFVAEALSENVLAGNVMNRRATYMYGNLLRPGVQGFVSTGLGAALSMGNTGFIPPTDTITRTGERRTIDGVEFIFQMTMGTEAPAEFVFYLPQFKALCMSEITSHHLHNVYTPRGAQVRDALAWSEQIQESIELFGGELDIQFASHHWPIWGQKEAVDYLCKQRDLYKYIHDQTLRLANHGYTKEEIAEQIRLPDSLAQEFYNRGYYGSVHHNARAVYVKYLGYFSGNPAELHPLPPKQAAERYIKFMGGADAVVTKAHDSYASGDYRWVAEVLNHIMMVDPEHTAARSLLADAYEQMGYQAESAPWRNFYLCGALELRQGLPQGSNYRASPGVARGMPVAQVLQLMAVRLLPEKVDNQRLTVRATLTDTNQTWTIRITNSVLRGFAGATDVDQVDFAVTCSEWNLKAWLLGFTSSNELKNEANVEISGNVALFEDFSDLFDDFPRRFPIVTGRPDLNSR